MQRFTSICVAVSLTIAGLPFVGCQSSNSPNDTQYNPPTQSSYPEQRSTVNPAEQHPNSDATNSPAENRIGRDNGATTQPSNLPAATQPSDTSGAGQ